MGEGSDVACSMSMYSARANTEINIICFSAWRTERKRIQVCASMSTLYKSVTQLEQAFLGFFGMIQADIVNSSILFNSSVEYNSGILWL